jgi:hypothetical protein
LPLGGGGGGSPDADGKTAGATLLLPFFGRARGAAAAVTGVSMHDSPVGSGLLKLGTNNRVVWNGSLACRDTGAVFLRVGRWFKLGAETVREIGRIACLLLVFDSGVSEDITLSKS